MTDIYRLLSARQRVLLVFWGVNLFLLLVLITFALR